MLDDQRTTLLRELIDAQWDGTMTEQQLARLQELACRDDDASRFYLDYMALHGLLMLEHTEYGPSDLPSGALDEMSRVNGPACNRGDGPPVVVLGFLSECMQQGASFLSKPLVLSLLLAIGLPLVLLVMLLIDIGSQSTPVIVAGRPPADAPPNVARVVQSREAVWEEPGQTMPVGALVKKEQRILLKKGLVELAFTDGVHVVLEGPAEFEATGNNKAVLKDGRFVANVPKRAVGFTIVTPVATIVDLGTEFGLSVANGTSEVHVFKGQVEVKPKSNEKGALIPFEKLTVGQAARIDLVGTGQIQVEKLTSSPEQFVRRLPPRSTDGLPEPTVLFAHRDSDDPAAKRWKFVSTEPNGQRHEVTKTHGLTEELRNEARAKGWVLRAKLKVVGQGAEADAKPFCGYWDTDRQWRIRPNIGPDGQQSVVFCGETTLGTDATFAIPDSRGRFVDYEVRYCPKTDDADVYIDNRFVATIQGTRFPNIQVIQFGTQNKKIAELHCEEIEWGIIRK